MRRRDFVRLLSGAAVAWPITSRAQQSERPRRMGLLMPFPDDRAPFPHESGCRRLSRAFMNLAGSKVVTFALITVSRTKMPNVSASVRTNWLGLRRI